MKTSKSKIKAFDIPNTTQSIKTDYEKGIITLKEAAIEFHTHGFTNFIDIEYTKRKLVKPSNNRKVDQLIGNYQFDSPYHEKRKMLPFNVLGPSYNSDYPLSVYTVEYKGYTKHDHYGNYNIATVQELIDSGFITKIS